VTGFASGPYTLSVIAETGEQFTDFSPYVAAIDERGTVAFSAALTTGGSGVFRGEGGPVTTVANSASGGFRTVCSHPDISSAGSICFYGENEEGAPALFVAQEGGLAALSDSAGPLGPTMNETGAVAFRAPLPAGGSRILTSHAGIATMVADTSGMFSGFHGLPVIDGGGCVTFRADCTAGGEGIYRSGGNHFEAVVETGDRFSSLGFFPFANDEGTVAFCAELRSSRAGVHTASAGEVTTVIDTNGPFESFRGALLTAARALVFYATPRGGELGIFVGPDPGHDCLLSVGSPLAGSTVAGFALNPVSINRAGQLAIRVALENGRQLILRADPAIPA